MLITISPESRLPSPESPARSVAATCHILISSPLIGIWDSECASPKRDVLIHAKSLKIDLVLSMFCRGCRANTLIKQMAGVDSVRPFSCAHFGVRYFSSEANAFEHRSPLRIYTVWQSDKLRCSTERIPDTRRSREGGQRATSALVSLPVLRRDRDGPENHEADR